MYLAKVLQLASEKLRWTHPTAPASRDVGPTSHDACTRKQTSAELIDPAQLANIAPRTVRGNAYRVITYSWAVAKSFADSRKNTREVTAASFLLRRSMPPPHVPKVASVGTTSVSLEQLPIQNVSAQTPGRIAGVNRGESRTYRFGIFFYLSANPKVLSLRAKMGGAMDQTARKLDGAICAPAPRLSVISQTAAGRTEAFYRKL